MPSQIVAKLTLFKVDFDDDGYCAPTCPQCKKGCCTVFSPALKEDRTPRADGRRPRLTTCIEAGSRYRSSIM